LLDRWGFTVVSVEVVCFNEVLGLIRLDGFWRLDLRGAQWTAFRDINRRTLARSARFARVLLRLVGRGFARFVGRNIEDVQRAVGGGLNS